MNNRFARTSVVLLVLALMAVSVYAQDAGQPTKLVNTFNEAAFERDFTALSQYPHRLAGFGERRSEDASTQFADAIDPFANPVTRLKAEDAFVHHRLMLDTDPNLILEAPGSLAASAYVQNRLDALADKYELGTDDFQVFVQEFDLVQPVTTECRLSIEGTPALDADGADLLQAVMPNHLWASVTPEEGLEGQAIYVAKGRLEDYGDALIRDKIVLLDPDGDWLGAFTFGAQAVIFIGDYKPGDHPVNHLDYPMNLPRFYLPVDAARKLGLLTGTPTLRIQAAAEWRPMRGRNIIAVRRGSDPQLENTTGPARTILLAAPLDSLSEIPQLAPGARDAANAALLLQMTEYVIENQPKRDIIIAFFDGQYASHAGAKAFYSAIHRPLDKEEIGPSEFKVYFAGENYLEAGRGGYTEKGDYVEGTLQQDLDFQYYALQILRQKNIYEPDTADMKAELKELRDSVGGSPFMGLGPALRSSAFVVLTLALLTVALGLAFLCSRLARKSRAAEEAGEEEEHDDVFNPRVIAAMGALRRLTWGISLVMMIAVLYAMIPDRMIFDDQRAELAEKYKDINKKIDDRTKQIDGLERSHRSTLDRLKEIAREKNSDVLELLRPKRFEKNKIESTLEADHKELEALLPRQAELEAQVKSASETDRDVRIAELNEFNASMSEIQARIDTAQIDLDAMLPEWTRLTVEDMLYNTALRIIQKKQDATDTDMIEERSRQLTDDDPDRQAAMRKLFIARMTGDPEAGVPGMFEQLTQQAIESRKLRRDELLNSMADLTASKALWNAVGPLKNIIDLHLCLNLGDVRDQWTFLHGDTTAVLGGQDHLGIYTDSVFSPILESAEGVKAPNFDKTPLLGEQTTNYGGPSIDSSGVARIFGVYNLSLRTVLDQLDRQGQPYDTVENVNLDRIVGQALEAMPVIRRLADNESLHHAKTISGKAYYEELSWDGDKNIGPKVLRASAGHAMRSHAVEGAVIAIHDMNFWVPPTPLGTAGYVGYPLYMTDSRGNYTLGPVWGEIHFSWRAGLAAKFDTPEGGKPSRGIIRYFSSSNTYQASQTSIFKTRSFSAITYGPTRKTATRVMRAISSSQFQPKQYYSMEVGQLLFAFVPFEAGGIKLFNSGGIVLLNNTPTTEGYDGVGIPLASDADQFVHPATTEYSAHDLNALNTVRLELLRNNRINEESIWWLSAKSLDLLDDIEKFAPSATDGQPGNLALRRAAYQASAAALSRRAYDPLMGVMNDLVGAVVLLLLFAMPFAYAMERLIVGTPHIYRQITGFALFFMATFMLLFMVNPAFKIASQPIIIFLAFTIILLSSSVIFILIRKLQTEVKRSQGLGATVHNTDVSRISTMGAAVMMGISTMRRRPLRTALTAATILLLTFTILTFASFGKTYGNKKAYKGPMSSIPSRVVLRDPLWSPMNEAIYTILKGTFGDRAEVVQRVWASPTSKEVQDATNTGETLDHPLAAIGENNRVLLEDHVSVSAAIGLDIRDIQNQPAMAALFPENVRLDLLSSNGIILTQAIATQLGLSDDDIGVSPLSYAGREVIFAGVVSDKLASHTMLEGSNIIPVDYQISGGGADFESMQAQTASNTGTGSKRMDMPEMEGSQFSPYSIDEVIVLGVDFAREMGGKTRSVTIYPRGDASAEDIANLVAMITDKPTYYGGPQGIHRLHFTKLTEASGLKDLVVPVVLGGLIIFATMLGSVSDREQEIYTFSSLGLAPPHVASLFFAEASVYAIIGGMGGYLFGQTVARLVGWLAAQPNINIAVPDMNYSSSNAIWTIVVVMGTVMISTIYPAIKASRSANPGIQRAWKIPRPEANLYDLIFPFTVSAYDITGVVSFLKEHFDNYTDTSLGIFATSKVTLFRQKDSDMIGIMAEMALAPFDLGVNQRFALLSQPSEIEGIDEVRILIYRLTGTNGDWRRANRVFINDLRKQLLIWRSLKTPVMDEYRSRTLEAWDSLPVQQIDETTIGDLA
jgi:hypothetical protein